MSEDRRKTYRYPITEEGEPAILHRRNRNWQVLITEKSAGGFRVTCSSQPKLAVGDSAMLEMAAYGVSVRVVHLTPGENNVQIGLELIHEAASAAAHGGEGAGALKSGLLVVVGAVAAAITGVFLFSDHDALRQRFDDWRNDAAVQPEAAGSIGGEPLPLGRGFMRPVGMTPERFRRELRLTPRQQAEIDSIVDDTTAALRATAALQRGDDNAWSDAGAQIIRQSWQRMQQVLSREQQQRWNELAAPQSMPQLDQQAQLR